MENSPLTSRTGPLTDTQHKILRGLTEGKTHAQIGRSIGRGRTYVANCLTQAIYPKLGIRKSTEASAMYTRYLTYLQVADWLLNARIRDWVSTEDEHMNHVLESLAEEYRKMAERMLPS